VGVRKRVYRPIETPTSKKLSTLSCNLAEVCRQMFDRAATRGVRSDDVGAAVGHRRASQSIGPSPRLPLRSARPPMRQSARLLAEKHPGGSPIRRDLTFNVDMKGAPRSPQRCSVHATQGPRRALSRPHANVRDCATAFESLTYVQWLPKDPCT
jgi:hypothetical protein